MSALGRRLPVPFMLLALSIGFAPGAVGAGVIPMHRHADAGPHVLYAPAFDDSPDFRAALAALLGGTVDYYDARASTPDAGLLSGYDCVYTWPNNPYFDANQMGDRLADYVDGGGRVVLGTFSTYTLGISLGGRIMTDAYCPVISLSGGVHTLNSEYGHDGGPCLFAGVQEFGFAARDSALATQGSGAADGHYVDGEIFDAYRPDFAVVYVNALPANLVSGCIDLWPQLIANAVTCHTVNVVAQTRTLPAALTCARCAGGDHAIAVTARGASKGNVGRAVVRTDGQGPANATRSASDLGAHANAGTATTPASANVLTAPGPLAGPRMLYAPSEADDPAYRAAIAAITGGTVDYFDARLPNVPDAATLASYDCVYTWVDFFPNQQLFGDRLADYVDRGGKVILGVFCSYTQGNYLGGRIMNVGYSPVTSASGGNHFAFSGKGGDGSGCAYNGVTAFSGYFRDVLTPQGGAVIDGHFADGEIAVAHRADNRVWYINGVGATQIVNAGCFPTACETGDWARLVANAALCAPTTVSATGGILVSTATGQLFKLLGSTPFWVGTLPRPAGALDVSEIENDPATSSALMQTGDGYPFLQGFDIQTRAAVGSTLGDGASFGGLEFVNGTLYGASTAGGTGPSILYAPTEDDDPIFRAGVAAFTGGRVDYFDARACTPTPDLLDQYDCVYTWVDGGYADRQLFGDRLADYVDRGHRAILGVFCTFTSGNLLGGRIMSPGYCPVISPSGSNHLAFSAYAGDGSTCIHTGVTTYRHYYRDVLSLQAGGAVDGHFQDGEIATAYRASDDRVVYINGGAADQLLGGLGDWYRLVANAALCGYTANPPSTLQTLDPTTGAATPIGPTGFGPIVGLAYDQSGNILYGLTQNRPAGSQLITLDRTTGQGTLFASFTFDGASLDLTSDGRMYAGGSAREGGRLYRVNLLGHTASLIGPPGVGGLTGLVGDVRDPLAVPTGRGPLTLGFGAIYPNPAAVGPMIEYSVARAGRVRLRVFDLGGRLVSTLVDRALEPGRYRATWSAARTAEPGVYFVRLDAEGRSLSSRIAVMR